MTKRTRWASLFIVILSCALGSALLATAAPAQERGWQIVRAVYGSRSRQTDVTDLLSDLISRGGVNGRIAVNNQTMGGDPAVGKDKTLRVFARDRDGDQREFDFSEGSFIPVDMFAVPDRDRDRGDDRNRGDNAGPDDHYDRDGYRDRDRHRRLEILWGFYGVQRHEANVTDLLQQMVDHGRLSVSVNNRSMGGDPAVGANKILIVVYRFDGVEQAASVPEGGVLEIP
jgi:hypothetical protein